VISALRIGLVSGSCRPRVGWCRVSIVGLGSRSGSPVGSEPCGGTRSEAEMGPASSEQGLHEAPWLSHAFKARVGEADSVKTMVRRLISGVGRTLITVGTLLLLFVAYQLWGTGLKYDQLQNKAGKSFAAELAAAGQPALSSDSAGGFGGFSEAELADAAAGKAISASPPEVVEPPFVSATTTSTLSATPVTPVTPVTPANTAPAKTVPAIPNATRPPTTIAPPSTLAPKPAAVPVSTLPKVKPGRTQMKRPVAGASLGHIVIPRIKMNQIYVSGAGVEDLKTGPGHYPSTALPGLDGNAGIACHRTTYGAPCLNLNLLKTGDVIGFVTLYGKFAYKVEKIFVVGPKDRTVLAPTPGQNVLTMTTCHPAYTARERLVIRARLVGEALDEDLVFEPEVVPVAAPVVTVPRPKPTIPVTTAVPTTLGEPVAFDTAAPVVPDDGLASESTVVVPSSIERSNALDPAFQEVGADTSVPGAGTPDTQAGVSLTDDSANVGSGPIRHFGWFTGKQSFWISTLSWAAACAAIWFAAWLFVRNRRRLARALVYTFGFFLLFLPALYFCFENLTHLLPENV
jgi:LPXTG-site transpeptidase (sortase) family protein